MSAPPGYNTQISGTERVLIGMSGGRESAVAALLLKNQGFDVIGLHISQTDQTSKEFSYFKSHCTRGPTFAEVKKICEAIGIPLKSVDASAEYLDQVVDDTVHQSINARFALPCTRCHSLRLNTLFQMADQLKCPWVAGGYYAQVLQGSQSTGAQICRSVEDAVDQSYYLVALKQDQIKRLILPIGGLSQSIVTKMAAQFDLPRAAQTSGPCAIGTGSYNELVALKIPSSMRIPGSVRGPDRLERGRHEGIYQYQVGQRENLPIELEDEENFFITRTSLIDHSIDLGPEAQLYRQKAYASSVVWQSPIDQLRELRCQAQFGPRPQNAASCGVFLFENQTIHVLFDQPQRVLVRGQMIAFYDGNALLGHAWIDKVDEE